MNTPAHTPGMSLPESTPVSASAPTALGLAPPSPSSSSPSSPPPTAPPTPPVVRRIGWWFLPPAVLVVIGAALLIFVPGATTRALRASGLGSALMPLLFQVPFMVTWIFVFRAQRSIRRAVLASAGRSCTHCLHDLAGLDDVGACPECGHAFDISRDRQAWQRVGALRPGEC